MKVTLKSMAYKMQGNFKSFLKKKSNLYAVKYGTWNHIIALKKTQ